MDKPAVTFIAHDGSERVACARSQGETVMEIARRAGIRGILAECGGNLACATCRVHVEPPWTDRLSAPSELESALLESADDPREGDRLSCQIPMSDALDGLRVVVPRSPC